MLPDYPTIALDPIPGYPGYLICRIGVVFSLKSRSKKLRGTPTPMRASINSDGYLFVSICVNSREFLRTIHQLVLETYIGPKPSGQETRHLNNQRQDNRLSNLAWGTRQENGADMATAGSVRGERHPGAKLMTDDIRTIRTMRPCDAARKYGITPEAAGMIKRRINWKHID